MGMVARAEPDGYTILLSTSAYSVKPGALSDAALRPVQGFLGDLRARRLAARIRGQG